MKEQLADVVSLTVLAKEVQELNEDEVRRANVTDKHHSTEENKNANNCMEDYIGNDNSDNGEVQDSGLPSPWNDPRKVSEMTNR